MAQYACTKCCKWFLFEQLTKDSQLCQQCTNFKSDSQQSLNGNGADKKAAPSHRSRMRCKYCRTELLDSGQSKSHPCDRCTKNKHEHGEPRNCSICNLTAAFIGSKCRRCAGSVKKYGLPQSCHQCKLKAAFDHPKATVDGKLLCWLCISTNKRAMKKIKRRASEDILNQKMKKSKKAIVKDESEDSPTELVIEEEIIHEKYADTLQQHIWTDLPTHDMDYRLPRTSLPVESRNSMYSENYVEDLDKSQPQPDEMSDFKASPSVFTSNSRRMKNIKSEQNIDEQIKSTDKLYSDDNNTDGKRISRKHKQRLKESRNADLKTKHSLKASSNNQSATGSSSTKLLDAKIHHMRRKMEKTSGKSFLASQNGERPVKPVDLIKKKVAVKDATTQSPSVSALQTSDNQIPTSSVFDRFRTTDSGSSSPLPVVNDSNIVVVTQLRAEISGLKKQVGKKEQELIEKDKQISCIKVEHLREQRDLRAKMKELTAKHMEALEQLQAKNGDLLRKVSQLSKGRA